MTTLQPKSNQSKSEVGSYAARSDADIENSKKPTQDLGRAQVVAAAGDTVPVVFCKRTEDDGGGVWMQPSLVKQGSANFDGVFLYAISQGEMESSPATVSTYLGEEVLEFQASTVTLAHKYASASTMAAAPNVSPIGGDKIFPDPDTSVYLYGFAKKDHFVHYWEANEEGVYWNFREKTIGEGDTTNSVLVTLGTDFEVKELETGTDRTSEYWSTVGLNPSTTTFYENARYENGGLVGGKSVGTITGGAYTSWSAPITNFFSTVYGTTNPVVEIYNNVTLNNQINTSNAASTGTLFGVLFERGSSIVSDPTSFPDTYNFSTFADITFLLLEGDIYDPPSANAFPTTPRQLTTFYEKGVKVAKYSTGSSGTVEASNSFIDLAMYLFRLINRIDDTLQSSIVLPMSTANLQDLATFCSNNSMFFNGIIEQSVNVVDYISKTAQFFLLTFVSANGQFSLRPLLPLTSGNEISTGTLAALKTFTETDILPGSFQKTFKELDNRRNINVSCIYREVTPTEVGLTKTVTVRYSYASIDSPVEQFDMTDFCTSADHAILFAKYELAQRRHSTHTISFSTPLLRTTLVPSDIIKVVRQRKNSVGDDQTETNFYQLTNVKHSSNGTSVIQAVHFPVNDSNVASISDDVVNGDFTVS